MDGAIMQEGASAGCQGAKLDLLIRAGRGRTGGSTGLDLTVPCGTPPDVRPGSARRS
jgi:hypothetical protein